MPKHVSRRARAKAPTVANPILRSGIVGLMVACGVAAVDLAIPDSANAQSPAKQTPSPKPSQGPLPGAKPAAPAAQAGANGTESKQEPVLLTADQVTFDEVNSVVTASGNVELAQGKRSVHADKITYNQKTKVVTATGKIRLVEPSGDIVFADYAELTDNLKDVFIENIRVLMTDNGRMAGNEGERREGRLTRVSRGVYSPCDLCKEDPTRPPLWQIRAVRIVHDNEEHEVRYRDATMEIFGIPVAYTPYLSHPDPSVDRKSGFLTPSFGNNSNLGAILKTHYYWDIAPDQDATFDLHYYSQQGPLLGGQYRKRFESGRLELEGAITRGDVANTTTVPKETRNRGYVAARGLFDIDDTWRAGFDIKRASDPTFLRRYYDFREDYLTSKVFVEGFRGRNYAAITGYSFQDMRYGNSIPEPVTLPYAQYNALGEPGSLLGGRWSFDTSLLAVSRFKNAGPDTQRVMAQPGWERNIVSNAGFVTTLSGSVLVAGYKAQQFNNNDPTVRGNDNISRFRFFPQGQATVRYPFVRYGESSSQLIEPIGQLTFAPKLPNGRIFPNEDSLDVEFDDVNLLQPNRFTGIDRLDDGMRVTYGLRGAIYGYNQGSASLFLGQSIRLTDSSAGFTGDSGLEERVSDYVGRLDLQPADWLDVNYGFRVDHETFRPRRHSLNASAGVPLLRLSTSYTYVDQTTSRTAVTRNRVEQASFGVSSQFTDHWNIGISHTQAMEPQPGPRASLAVLTYGDECLLFQTIARRDYTISTTGEKDGNTIFFRLVFKNVGEFKSPGISAGFLGGGSANQ
ncbi:organic solvent tolerance protein [Azospirillum sp. TSH100]|uniref:LPS-assembly protein LptD n=1 Tax=Azospirillum sp. TSH100 TaxID=652764 RepID=UPI000D618983|nr:LPS assembly protein LptD [Azospirillum sp. TSH100]PWC82018.1 organic solvent tolerance protein [Azospirillum sp. TSH100]QCG88086.1 LPS-assembly protein LptD [Azospirillum sp. TSH100]